MKASDPLYDANCHDQDRAPWTMEDTWACGPAWVAQPAQRLASNKVPNLAAPAPMRASGR